jgi:hypothetical protein
MAKAKQTTVKVNPRFDGERAAAIGTLLAVSNMGLDWKGVLEECTSTPIMASDVRGHTMDKYAPDLNEHDLNREAAGFIKEIAKIPEGQTIKAYDDLIAVFLTQENANVGAYIRCKEAFLTQENAKVAPDHVRYRVGQLPENIPMPTLEIDFDEGSFWIYLHDADEETVLDRVGVTREWANKEFLRTGGWASLNVHFSDNALDALNPSKDENED